MIGRKLLFTSFVECNKGKVIFGDSATAHICGKGTIECFCMPNFENVLYIAGLKANLISISQLCSENFKINFLNEACTVVDKNCENEMKTQLIYDNYYGILSLGKLNYVTLPLSTIYFSEIDFKIHQL